MSALYEELRARKFIFSQVNKQQGPASSAFLGAIPSMTALIFCSPLTARITISRNNPAVFGQGVVIPISTTPVVLKIEDYGSWLTGDLFAIAEGAGVVDFSIIVVASLLPDLY